MNNDNNIVFHLVYGGCEDPFFSDRIMVRANKENEQKWCVNIAELLKDEKESVGKLVRKFMYANNLNSLYPFNELSEDAMWECAYFIYNNSLIGLKEDKSLSEICRDLHYQDTDIDIFIFSIGGASFNIERGYKLIIHSDEQIHKNDQPHVHVNKNGCTARYYILTGEVMRDDKRSQEMIRDEKNIIIPGIIKNRNDLLKNWNLAIAGYEVPCLDEDGNQYYPMS